MTDERFRPIAQRIVNAENGFLDNLKETFGLTDAEAVKVLDVFIEAKAVKLDPIMGVYNLKHGAFWEVDVIKRALAQGVS